MTEAEIEEIGRRAAAIWFRKLAETLAKAADELDAGAADYHAPVIDSKPFKKRTVARNTDVKPTSDDYVFAARRNRARK